VLPDVRGFDPSADRFTYAVNPRFGSTSPTYGTIRAPFRATLDVSVDIAPSQNERQLDRWLRPGRGGRPGQKVNAADLARRFRRTVPDAYREVLEEADSLLLAPEQSVAITAGDAAYRIRIDSIWNRLGDYLGALPDRYDARDALKRTDVATDDAVGDYSDHSATGFCENSHTRTVCHPSTAVANAVHLARPREATNLSAR